MRKNRTEPFHFLTLSEETQWIGEALHLQEKDSHRSISPNFLSPPLHQKSGVIKTLLDRSESIVTEAIDHVDRKKEELNIRQALSTACGYPEWTVNKVKQHKLT